MSEYEKHVKEMNRIRAKRHYEANKENILKKRKEKRVEINEILSGLQDKQKKQPKMINGVINTNQEAVTEAMKTTEYYKNEATRKTNLQQIPLIFRATKGLPLLDALHNPEEFVKNVKNLKQKNGDYYAISGTPRVLGCVLGIIDFMQLLIPKKSRIDKVLFHAYRTAKLEYDIELYNRKHPTLDKSTAVKKYDKIVDEVKKKFGIKSLQYLLVKLYQFAPLRNDFSNIILTENDSNLEPNKNYMILPRNGNACILIQKHKTVRTAGIIEAEFPTEITTLIRNYTKTNKIEYGNKLFGDLKNVLHEITGEKDDNVDGGTKMLRRSIASTLYNNYVNRKATVEDIYKQTRIMAHSTETHFKDYVYSVK